MRARLHAKDGRFGFFREGTHELCDAGPTQQLLPSTLDALRRLQASLASAGVAGVVSCEISENVEASERAVLLELDSSEPAPIRIEEIEGITGVLFADRQGSRLTVAYGSPYVTDRIEVAGHPATLVHHVQSFFQGNRYLLPELVARVLAQVPEGDVTDLYAGAGLFAVSLAVMGRAGIIAVEGDRSSAHDLDANAAPYLPSITVVQSSVELYVQQRGMRKLPTLVLDPPRTGMSREAMSGVLALTPPRVGPRLATVAHVRRFVEAGYTLSTSKVDIPEHRARGNTGGASNSKGATRGTVTRDLSLAPYPSPSPCPFLSKRDLRQASRSRSNRSMLSERPSVRIGLHAVPERQQLLCCLPRSACNTAGLVWARSVQHQPIEPTSLPRHARALPDWRCQTLECRDLRCHFAEHAVVVRGAGASPRGA